MNTSQIEATIKYITDAQGEKTEVIVPIELWNHLLQKVAPNEIYDTESGLSPIDEDEPKSQILTDLKASIQSVKVGEVYPVARLWDNIDN